MFRSSIKIRIIVTNLHMITNYINGVSTFMEKEKIETRRSRENE